MHHKGTDDEPRGTKDGGSAGESVIYRNLLDGFRKMVAAEGALSVYKGLGIVLVGAAPAQALFFTGMTAVQSVFSPKSDLGNFGAGLAAQVCGSLSWVPMEVIKEKMMIQGQIATKETYWDRSTSCSAYWRRKEYEASIAVVLQQMTYGPFNGLALVFYNRFKSALPDSMRDSVVGNGAASTLIMVLPRL